MLLSLVLVCSQLARFFQKKSKFAKVNLEVVFQS